jgi:1-deoxy-D-xylulose-5-phosphate reductoisomerase
MKKLAILGSTGSIGNSTLDVVGRSPERYSVFALAAGRNIDKLIPQIAHFRPKVAVVATSEIRTSLMKGLGDLGMARSEWPELLCGSAGMVEASTAPEVDFVMSAAVGVAGLEATFEAVQHSKAVGLANKEVLVASGELVMGAATESGTELIPVDSEHNGAHQCLRAGGRSEVERLILTASGGPFRETPIEEFDNVTPEQALNHPTWRMGPRITIDSATMMNKGFEVIEASWLFGLQPQQVDVVVHPQSKVHAMVEYCDGSVIAQISATDMRMPIQYALTYPDRCNAPVPRMDWSEARRWDFFPPDPAKFRLLDLAYQALKSGGSAGCTLNAADEIAVEEFLAGRLGFADIAAVVEDTLNKVPRRNLYSIEEVLEVDAESRSTALAIASNRRAGMRISALQTQN